MIYKERSPIEIGMQPSALVKLLSALNRGMSTSDNFLHLLHESFKTVSLTLQYNKFVIRCQARVLDDLFPAGKIMSSLA